MPVTMMMSTESMMPEVLQMPGVVIKPMPTMELTKRKKPFSSFSEI